MKSRLSQIKSGILTKAFYRRYSVDLSFLNLFLGGLAWMLILNFNYLSIFLGPTLPGGMDSSGHFAIAQLYSDSYWPAWDGSFDSYFQGFSFPRFYPPLFYQLVGALYHLFPEMSRALLFKLVIALPCLFLPGLLSVFYKKLSASTLAATAVLFLSSILLNSDDEVSRYMVGLKEALETGLCTQTLSTNILLLLLIVLVSKSNSILRLFAIVLLSAALFLSNVHIIIFTTILLSIYFGILFYLQRKIKWALIFSIVLGFVIASPWYINAFIHRYESPTIPTENFNFSQMLLTYAILSLLANIFALIFSKKVNSRLAVFCCASLLSLPIFCMSIEPLGIRLPWQPHRLLAMHNLFLSVYLVYAFEVLLRFSLTAESWLKKRVILAGLILFVVVCFTYKPVKMIHGVLGLGESDSIIELNEWLKSNPAKGYSLVSFTTNPGWLSPYDIALSHYIVLVGERSIWGVFRESSFNSIFATTLRNLVSTRVEQWGIPNRLGSEVSKEIDFEKKSKILSRWGVERLIIRTPNLLEVIPKMNLVNVLYQNPYVTVVDLKYPPILTEHAYNAVFFVSSPINRSMEDSTPDLAMIAQFVTVEPVKSYPILLFRSCEELKTKISGSWKVACTQQDDCCTKIVSSFEEIRQPQLLNSINLTIDNKTPQSSSELIAAPWRRAVVEP